MRGAGFSQYMQDEATLREYEKAKRLGAEAFAKAVRNANPHLTEAFDLSDAVIKSETQAAA